MVGRRRSFAGFTLIELMVTIVIMVLLLLVAAPFAIGWVDGVRQVRARSNLVESFGQARALAMRNPLELAAAQAAAAVVWDKTAHTLYVVSRKADNSGWDDQHKWQGQIVNPGSLALRTGAAAHTSEFVCAAFDARGRMVDSDHDGAACVAPSSSVARVHIHVGSQEAVDVALL